MNAEIQKLEDQIAGLTAELQKLRRASAEAIEVPHYSFGTTTGTTDLASLFCGKKILFAIHNMGQGCRYCTLWADGLNGFLPHLEDRFSVVLLSKNTAIPLLETSGAGEDGGRCPKPPLSSASGPMITPDTAPHEPS